MNKFRIENTCIDTTASKKVCIESGCEFDYVLTSISSNNDYIAKSWLKKKETKLIVRTDFSINLSIVLPEHLKEVGREFCDILIVDSDTCTDLTEIRSIVSNNMAKHIGVCGSKYIDAIKELSSKGVSTEYFAVTVCPLDFDYSAISYAEKSSMRIIGMNPMGGYISGPRNIEAFTVPYLLSFCSYYSDIVVCSGRSNYTESMNNKTFLDGLIGKESNPMFDLSKSINKSVKPINNAITTELTCGEDTKLDYIDSTFLPIDSSLLSLKLGPGKIELNESLRKQAESDVISKNINDYIKLAYLPDGLSHGSMAAAVRYVVLNNLDDIYKDSGCTREVNKIGNSIFFFEYTKEQIIKGFLWKLKVTPKVEDDYILYVGDSRENILFWKVEKSKKEEDDSLNI